KCAGIGWWNGTSIWRALTLPPFNFVDAEMLRRWNFMLPIAGVLICLLETAYPFLIWNRRAQASCLICVCAMHVMIGLTMGMYQFALIMIMLNLAAFGPGFAFNRSAASKVACPTTAGRATLLAKDLSA